MGLIRFLLAVAVVLGHTQASYSLIHASEAVQAFYMISGFYMALVLDGRYTSNGVFWTNRLIRLLPGYWLIALLSAAWLWRHQPGFFSTMDPYEALVNLTIAGQDTLLFGAGNWQDMLVPQAWTLSLELYFYALAPFLVRLRTRNILALLILSAAARAIAYAAGYDVFPWRNRFFPFELIFFLAGILAYRAYQARPQGQPLAVAAAAALIFVQPLIGWEGRAPAFFLLFWLLLPAAFAATRNSAFDRFIGELSYPIYINHYMFLRMYGIDPPMVLACSVALGVATLLVLENPLSRWRERRVATMRRTEQAPGQCAADGARQAA